MSTRDNQQNACPDPEEWAAAIAKTMEQGQRIMAEFMQRQDQLEPSDPDPLNIGDAFIELTTQMLTDPGRLAKAQIGLWSSYVDVWQQTAQRLMGQDVAALHEPENGDRRFKHSAWSDNPLFDFIKQTYLLSSRWMIETVRTTEGLDDETARKVEFYTRQFADAMAPSNFAFTNPAVLQETVETKGQNLLKGLSNLLDDLEHSKGQLRVKMVDDKAFELGETVATTPGKVVFQNDLMQLIQYEPRTDHVRKRPLVIVPPWINKYYILDLREKNSFVKWAVEQGHTVFVISWVNPDSTLSEKTFEDYMFEGPIEAINAALEVAEADKVNLIGYCIGGTLTACALAWMAAKNDDRVASATYFATLVDFQEPGDLGVFIDEKQVANLEKRMSRTGYLEGSDMATTFNMLRANDLIWSFVVNNYLMGKEPLPLDLFFWNADSTRMPTAMHSFYLRKMYLGNALAEPGGIELGGVPIDLGRIAVPTYILATREDHIAPWESTYAATRLYGGRTRFVLASSGHIAGVVNPPTAGKYSFRTNSRKPKNAETWLRGSTEQNGSWWPNWDNWIQRFGDEAVEARVPGSGSLPAIEDAPGSYVRVK